MTDLARLSVRDLLRLHASVIEELRSRGAVRSTNNPTGDYAEHLFCRAFGWRRAGKSEPDADAVGEDGARYQIKGRRLHRRSQSRQVGILRRLPERRFDWLAAVLFDESYGVLRAALVPHAQVLEHSAYQEHANGWRFMLRDEVWDWPGVRDVTEELRRVEVVV